jgi:hypothetical protein
MNEGWLSEDACREGISIGIPFIPFILDRLMGREKLNAGLGNLVPPTDISEQIEGDLGACVVGEMGEFERPLAVEGFRLGEIVTPIVEVWKSSSELSAEIDRGLAFRPVKGDLGGANALES